ncbi:MAG: hypothetical protein JW797_16395 [Bradymonadales bacterium]|nr:hypothetical protein [Bradymonadales bacterium]
MRVINLTPGVVLLSLVLLDLTGCGPALIDDSLVVAEDAKVEDNEVNREIITLVEEYRRALEDKDLATLRRLVSSNYYENGGTNDTADDDYGYDGLANVLEMYSQNIRQLHLSVQVKQIEVRGNRANVYMDFAYNMLYVVDGQERWQVDRNLNRLELIREGDRWRVLAGL